MEGQRKSGGPRQPAAPPKFKDLFCQRYQCPLSEYGTRALEHCLYWQAKVAAPWIRRWFPGWWLEDQRLIDDVGAATDARAVGTEIRAFQRELREERRTWHRRLRFRVSGGKLMALAYELFGESNPNPGQRAAVRKEIQPGV